MHLFTGRMPSRSQIRVIVDGNQKITRVKSVVDYIHAHLSDALSVESLARISCWSRWQLQRVFFHETGVSLAQYVRELRLSMAAEVLISRNYRQLDIALFYGFNSEVAFNRSFKQFFGLTPGAYRKRGLRVGLRTPLRIIPSLHKHGSHQQKLIQVRIETRPGFRVGGVCGYINGIFSEQPDFTNKVPGLWQQVARLAARHQVPFKRQVGVLVVAEAQENGCKIPYCAGIELTGRVFSDEFQIIDVPTQQYAVIPYVGPIDELHKTLEWFIFSWLPDSDYCGIDSIDLECYGTDFDADSKKACMEYWVPVQHRQEL